MTSLQNKHNIFWFRRDLRLDDNHGLYEALSSGLPIKPIFIFDQDILDKLDNPQDRRVAFIHSILSNIKDKLRSEGSDLFVYYGKPLEIWETLLKSGNVHNVYSNKDYEPYCVFKKWKGK